MDPVKIIQKYYKVDSKIYQLLVEHSRVVTGKALEVAKRVPQFNPDMEFIKEAAMLHDIGIFLTNAPDIYCNGDKLYICHGYLGKELLEKEGFPKHAKVCERHVGVGLSIQDIENQKLPLPKRNMSPITVEEEIICFADKFYSKNVENPGKEKEIAEIKNELSRFGDNKVKRFEEWMEKFGS